MNRQIDIINKRHTEAKKDFKNRCFLIIEALVSENIFYNDVEELKTEIYKIAHVGLGTCRIDHQNWKDEIEKMFVEFENKGLI